jgi:hypothetical protein
MRILAAFALAVTVSQVSAAAEVSIFSPSLARSTRLSLSTSHPSLLL